MTFDSESARKAQAKRKTHGTGAYLKHIQENDPALYKEIYDRKVAKYGGLEAYKKQLSEWQKQRWERQRNAKTKKP